LRWVVGGFSGEQAAKSAAIKPNEEKLITVRVMR
jgi:hypothetical protein